MIYSVRKALLIATVLLGVALAPVQAQAFDILNNACSAGGGDSAACANRSGTTNLTGTNGLIRQVVNIIAVVAGVVAVVVIIIAGLQYITSSGDPAKAQTAKDVIIYALVGLIVIALADGIISFVLSKL